MNNKVVVGLSGGVDSATTAFLLKSQGYDVHAVWMLMLECESSKKAMEDAKSVADFLELPFEVSDCRGKFEKYVINYFNESYKNGLTPNPCIMCNDKIKFKFLNEFREKKSAFFMATGHYANVDDGKLMNAKDTKKDQTYFLYRINKEYLQNIIFPLGKFLKTEIREIAERNSIPVHKKAESQDVCFINSPKIYRTTSSNPGNIVDLSGNIIGTHDGVEKYTIGQKKGLKTKLEGKYVIDIDAKNNIIIADSKGFLYTAKMTISDTKWLCEISTNEVFFAKLRSGGDLCKIQLVKNIDSTYDVLFDKEYEKIAFGQHCVFYATNIVLGGGIIVKS